MQSGHYHPRASLLALAVLLLSAAPAFALPSLVARMNETCGAAGLGPVAAPAHGASTVEGLAGVDPTVVLGTLMGQAANAQTPEGTVLAAILHDLLTNVTPKMIAYKAGDPGIGATCIPKFDATKKLSGYVLLFIGAAPPFWLQPAINPAPYNTNEYYYTAQMVHELTHCAVNERYSRWMVDYSNSTRNPAPTALLGLVDAATGCTNSAHLTTVQTAMKSPAADVILKKNVTALTALIPAAWKKTNPAPALYINELVGKVSYMGTNPALEYDAPLNHALTWCFQHADCRAQKKFYSKLAAVAEEAYCRRKTGKPVTAVAPAAPKVVKGRPDSMCK